MKLRGVCHALNTVAKGSGRRGGGKAQGSGGGQARVPGAAVQCSAAAEVGK